MKQFMSEIEVTPPWDFAARDQDGIEFGKTAGGARDAAPRFDHEHQYAEFPLYDLTQAARRDVAKSELHREPFTGLHGVLESGAPRQPKRAAHQRCAVSNRRGQGPESGDPAARVVFVGGKLFGLDTGVPPAETTFADQQERIGEVLQGSVQYLYREHQFLRSHFPDAGLNGRYGLPIVEAEQVGKCLPATACAPPVAP